MSNVRLVYSTDPKDNANKCSQCGLFKDECRCRKDEPITSVYTVIFRLEKSGRGGKTVTVMDGWPKNDTFLKDMTKELKNKCGTGGTHFISEKFGVIEIQGDKREQLKKILTSKKILFKGM